MRMNTASDWDISYTNLACHVGVDLNVPTCRSRHLNAVYHTRIRHVIHEFGMSHMCRSEYPYVSVEASGCGISYTNSTCRMRHIICTFRCPFMCIQVPFKHDMSSLIVFIIDIFLQNLVFFIWNSVLCIWNRMLFIRDMFRLIASIINMIIRN